MSFVDLVIQQTNTASKISKMISDLDAVTVHEHTIGNYGNKAVLLESYWKEFRERHNELVIRREYDNSNYAKQDEYSLCEQEYIKTRGLINQNIRLCFYASSLEHHFRQQWNKLMLINDQIGRDVLELGSYQNAHRFRTCKQRRDNKKVMDYIEELIELPVVAVESPQELTALRDNAIRIREGLRSLGRPVDRWNAWFIYIITQKLPADTRMEWMECARKRAYPSTFELLSSFINRRVSSLNAEARTTASETADEPNVENDLFPTTD